MNTDELLSYAIRHFGKNSISEVNDNPNLIAFSSPITKNWFALLNLDPRNKSLNINCGDFAGTIKDLPGFSASFLIKEAKWVEVSLGLSNQKIKKALEYAFKIALMSNKRPNPEKLIYIPDTIQNDEESVYHEQKLNFKNWERSSNILRKETNSTEEKINLNFEDTQVVPKEIKNMIDSYQYSLPGSVRREQNFYLQGKLMASYEDHYDGKQSFLRYYPTYHDLTVGQARTYFTWRTKIRQNIYEKISDSYAYIYLYELLNGIGIKNPEEGLDKLITFNKNYAQKFSPEMGAYLERWIRDYIIFYNINKANDTFFVKEQDNDKKYEQLLYPDQFSNHEVAENLIKLSNYKIRNSPLYKKSIEKFEYLLVLIWHKILDLRNDGFDFFTSYIAYKNQMTIQLFSAAVFNHELEPQTTSYEIDQIRKYFYDKEKDTWYCESYWGLTGQKSIMGNFLHEVDREIRLRFNLGRNLKPRKIEKHYLEAIRDGIKEYQIEEQKLKQPKIEFNLSQLSTIREDAAGTRDSLLTEEELQAEQEEREQIEETVVNDEQEDYGLSSEEMATIILLLKGKDLNKYLKEHHLMAAVIIDNINEKLFDEFGDNVIEFINDIPTVIEDYQEDLEDMFLKGTN
ncbi:TerB N-terminal domain-containing protein [Lactobacillus johnsonii]|uniref:TerB N- and C- terminal domain-containing protein n=1 Tax=Lactobacillus johnsonii TaxID=33959 RepID=UPI0028E2AE9B|nr:TerB N-terminal domain-containing protein [Lactobacillus johnsonii]MDT9606577.1 TerB N-terminal domain-containing protein [Lactobacillus johnsonii]